VDWAPFPWVPCVRLYPFGSSGKLADVVSAIHPYVLLLSSIAATGAVQTAAAQASHNTTTFAALSSRAESARNADRLVEAESL
jgi:hypothetical protein